MRPRHIILLFIAFLLFLLSGALIFHAPTRAWWHHLRKQAIGGIGEGKW